MKIVGYKKTPFLASKHRQQKNKYCRSDDRRLLLVNRVFCYAVNYGSFLFCQKDEDPTIDLQELG